MSRQSLKSKTSAFTDDSEKFTAFASSLGADNTVGDILTDMAGDVSLPDEEASQEDLHVEDKVEQALKVSTLPTELVQMFNSMRNELMALRQDLDATKGKQRSVANRTPVVEDVLSNKTMEVMVVSTGRFRYGTQLFSFTTPNQQVTLPEAFAKRLRKSGIVKFLDELY
jgi:hypothetical protein